MELSPATGDFRPYGIRTACPSVCGNSARSGILCRARLSLNKLSSGQPLFERKGHFIGGPTNLRRRQLEECISYKIALTGIHPNVFASLHFLCPGGELFSTNRPGNELV